uniref:Rabenosyn-5 n=1 Tax=Lygus hesperus TaxID=30085 RepID=A0A146KQ84_LYGHE
MASADTPVLEGFICPICKSDRGTAENLLSHFQDEHSDEQDLIKTFRDLLGMAKKKILKQESHSSSFNESPKYLTSDFEFVYDPQEIGVTNSHMALFTKVREDRLQRLAVPTNQLIIRLEKLLGKMPTDPQKRKAHEQNIVPWIDGSAVPRCPNCAGSFHLARRQHHCRLCGSVMCSDCSHFMAISTALRILDKPVKDEVTADSTQQSSELQQLRLCIHCIALLEVREEKRVSQRNKPIISQFYERLADYRAQAEKLNKEYLKMAFSLNAGETTYSLKEAQIAKVKLLRLSENIDSLSSKIAVLGTDSDNPPQGQVLRLQNMVRSACTTFLREQALNLPSIPNEEELERIQHRRREKITAKIHEEKMRRHRMNQSNSHKPSVSPNKSQTMTDQLSLGQGWVPETNKKANELEDPLIEQMNIIRIYIKEAKLANKTDEVASLEENLQELKKEFYRKQMSLEDFASRSGESSEAASLSSYDGGKTASESISSL